MKRSGKKMALFMAMFCGMLYPANSFAVFKSTPTWQQRSFPSTFSSSLRASSTTASASITGSSPPQLLEFKEPKTNVTVILVGSMHYNPASIQLARDTVAGLGKTNRLGSVVIEVCDIRWNSTKELHDKKPLLKRVLENEMRAAANAASLYQRPVVLGDQRINITTTRLKSAFQETLTDIVSLNWSGLYSDLQKAAEVALPSGPGYMDASGFFDSRLLLAAPVSLIKYPLSYIVRAPLASIAFLLFLSGLPMSPEPDEVLGLQDIVGSLLFAGLEIVVFLRIFVQALLAERNEVLARNILQQCQIYQSNGGGGNTGWLAGLFRPSFASAFAIGDEEIVYAPSGDDSMGASVIAAMPSNDNSEKVVVAVLGMAHCNGIKKLLQEELV